MLRYLPKRKGGRLSNVATFCTACDDMVKGDAVWNMERTLQSGEEASDGSFHVGIAALNAAPVVVKLMDDGRMARQEVRVQRLFRERPHPNIVQGICDFECEDSPIRWQRRLRAPLPLCVAEDGAKSIILVVQEYIEKGNVSALGDVWPMDLWTSVVQQLTFAAMEWFDTYGFLYGDWHLGNVLLDNTAVHDVVYRAFRQRWVVRTASVRPALTDFARSEVRPVGRLEPWLLASQLGTIWDMLHRECPVAELRIATQRASISIGDAESVDDIVAGVKDWCRHVAKT